jgi:hypothetical protein
MRKHLALAFLVLFLLGASQVSADIVQVIPANPTTADSVTLFVQSCGILNVTRIGNLFQIHINLCPFEPPVFPAPLGILPPGTYLYEIYEGPGTTTLVASGSFVVVPSVPALSPAVLIALFAVLVAAGWIFTPRQT